jgi:hypothetical protein
MSSTKGNLYLAHQLFSIAELLYADTRLNNVIFKFEAKKSLIQGGLSSKKHTKIQKLQP